MPPASALLLNAEALPPMLKIPHSAVSAVSLQGPPLGSDCLGPSAFAIGELRFFLKKIGGSAAPSILDTKALSAEFDSKFLL